MKKIVLVVPVILLTFGIMAVKGNGDQKNVNNKVKHAANVTTGFIGESLLVINDFDFRDTLDGAAKTETGKEDGPDETVKKGYEPLMELAPKGKKVFVVAEDKGVLAHTTKNIDYWHYWQVVENKAAADFVMEIKFRYGNLGRSFSYAIFYNTDGKEVYRTNEVDNFANADFNFKRSSVNNLMDNVVKPMFELY